MTKHTLYVTFDGLSDPLGQSQILPYLTGLAKNGYTITILSCEKKERVEKELSNIQSLLNPVSFSWNYILYDEVGGFLTRLNYIRKIYSLAKKENISKKFKLVHCRSYLAALIGLRLKRKYDIPFLFDMRGFWANERFDGNIWSRKNPLHIAFYKYFKIKEKQFLTESNAIVSLTHAAVKILAQNYKGIDIQQKTTVIPCCVNTSLFDPEKTLPISFPSLKSNEHLLVYTGSIGTWYYTKEMIDCVLAWQEFIPSLKLLIVTKDIKELETILSGYSEKERHIVLQTSVPYAQVPSVLACAKAAIFFIKPAFSKIASSPTNMAECWAMNLPIITNPGIGDNDIYFKEKAGGILVEGFNVSAYKSAAKKYLAMNKKDYREIALSNFDAEKAVVSYSGIYNALCNATSTNQAR
ncbi:MAG: glycosyltransferase [Bacteroidia bacterium]